MLFFHKSHAVLRLQILKNWQLHVWTCSLFKVFQRVWLLLFRDKHLLCFQLVRFLMITYKGNVLCFVAYWLIIDFLPISFVSIWFSGFFVRWARQSRFWLDMKCLPPVFWCHFEYKIVFIIKGNHFSVETLDHEHWPGSNALVLS